MPSSTPTLIRSPSSTRSVANDDAIRGIELLTSLMADAGGRGAGAFGKAAKAEGETEQPMAAWEKELLTEGAPAADAPAEAGKPKLAKLRLVKISHYDGSVVPPI